MRLMRLALFVVMLAGCASVTKEAPLMATWPTLDGSPPLVIAHRGASGYLPEHTLEAYALAIDQGADVIEPDLVFTKDGVLVARHDRYLSTTTDVVDHPEFSSRRRANGDVTDAPREDWWIEDFTLAELKTLRARQPFPGRSKEFDGLYAIPTFEEVLALVSKKATQAGRPVGVYPETKHPAFFRLFIGHDFEKPLLAALERFDAGPVFIQSFEPDILKRLKGKTNAKLVQLVDADASGARRIPLEEIAAYADGVGPTKALTLNNDLSDTGFVAAAHGLGLFVHPWTFDEPRSFEGDAMSGYFIFSDDRGATQCELLHSFTVGVDGVFANFPDVAVAVRKFYPPLSQSAEGGS